MAAVNNFNINNVYFVNETEDIDLSGTNSSGGLNEYNYILVPLETHIKISFSLNNPAANLINSYIKISSGSNYEIYSLAEVDANNLIFETVIPKLISNTNTIKFSCCDVTGADVVDSTSKEFHNYLYPLEIDSSNVIIKRCNESYLENTNGSYIKVNNLNLRIISGNIVNIQLLKIIAIKNSNTPETALPIVLIDKYADEVINNYNFIQGYRDNEYNHLFEDLNTAGFFSDLKFIYDFKIIIEDTPLKVEKELEENEDPAKYDYFNTYKRQINPIIISPFSGYSPLQLVGKTLLPNGTEVYGGVAIGQNPTIEQIGEAAFECGYPAYFNGIKYGYYIGDTITFDNLLYSISGFASGDKKVVNITFHLGQPIFANGFNITGQVSLLVDNAIVNLDLTTGFTITNFIINKKAGIITTSISRSSVITGSANHAVIMKPNPSFTITFI